MNQQALPMPYPPGYCERVKWQSSTWPTHIKDAQGRIVEPSPPAIEADHGITKGGAA